jgi:hypothetical protein
MILASLYVGVCVANCWSNWGCWFMFFFILGVIMGHLDSYVGSVSLLV